MPEGFGSVADLKMIAETNDAEFRAGLARMREGVREFQESSVAQFAGFDRGVEKSGNAVLDFAVQKLEKMGPYGKVAAEGLKLVRDNLGLMEDAIRVAGAGDQLDSLKQAFGNLLSASKETAISLAAEFSPGVQQAGQETNALGAFLDLVAQKTRDLATWVDSFSRDAAQSYDTLTKRIEELNKQLGDLNRLGSSTGLMSSDMRDKMNATTEAIRAQIAALEAHRAARKAADEAAADDATSEALTGLRSQIDLLQAQRDMLGKPGEFEWYKVELRAQAELEKAGVDDKASIARVLADMKAEYLGLSNAIADYNKHKQAEATVERTFAAMERETQNLRNRAAALNQTAGAAARLQAIESGLLAIRQARGGDATEVDVRRVHELADARAAEAQAADNARLRRERDQSFERQARGIEASTAALVMSTAEQARAAYVEQELQRIRQANRQATEFEIETINRNADAIREATQARIDMQETLQSLNETGSVIGRGLDNVFRSWANGAEMTKESIHDMAVSILADLAQIAFRKSVLDPLMEGVFGGGGSGGGVLSSLFGGARAGGGDVEAGKFYLVGEKGPELFAPRGSGSVIPNDKLGGGVNLTINQTIDARGAYPESIEEIKRAVAESNASMPQVAVAAVREASSRGAMS